MRQEAMPLPSRWTELRAHAVQDAYVSSPHRFNVLAAGRRSGKTERFKRKVVRAALASAFPWPARYFCGAPTREQAKRIFWEDVKSLLGRDMIASKSESELYVTTPTGNQIWIVGLDKPERIEGSPWDGGGLDEYANTKEKAWGAHIRPALSDRKGWCDLFGVPEGRNHYYKLAMRAAADMKERGSESEWGYFHWKSADILDAEEIEAARRDLDPMTFAQEYEASFINFEGRAYYPFDQAVHCGRLSYDERQPLDLCFDFNVAPGAAVVCQEQVLPGKFEHDEGRRPLLNRPVTGTGVIGEVHIPNNSNTPAVVARLVKDWGEHRGRVRVYGDATGGARGTAKVDGSDWDLIERDLRRHFKDRVSFFVKDANPPERARINAVNTRLLNGAGEVHMMVDAKRCPETVADLDGVALLKGGSGEIDKKASPLRTHWTDGLGYYIEYEFPIVPGAQRVELSGF